MEIKELINLHDDTIKRWHGREHYEYQKRIITAIISAIATAHTGKETVEIPIQLPRQSGKTTSIVDCVEFLLAASLRYLGLALAIGIFAPQKEQATTDFERLKYQFGELPHLGFKTAATYEAERDAVKFPTKWNSKAIRLYQTTGSYLGEVYIFPISKTSHPESKTLHLIIIEEAQDMDDERMQNAVFPMGASTNAPRIYVGTAGYKLCRFKRQIDTNPRAIKIKLNEVYAQRRAMFEKTGDHKHLLYEAYVNYEIKNEPGGRESEYIRTQYLGEWVIGSGQFTTSEEMAAIVGKHGTTNKADHATNVYVGIDTAKSPDQTICTAIADNPRWERARLLGWLALPGENYEDQFDFIKAWLLPIYETYKDEEGKEQKRLISGFEKIRAIGIDATGQGDFMPDKFERHTSYNIVRVKFSAETKDVIYKILQQTIKNKLTETPDTTSSMYRDFLQQMLDLEKEYKGRIMSVHHPKGKDAHDDYPDSWAIAEYIKLEIEKKAPRLSFM